MNENVSIIVKEQLEFDKKKVPLPYGPSMYPGGNQPGRNQPVGFHPCLVGFHPIFVLRTRAWLKN